MTEIEQRVQRALANMPGVSLWESLLALFAADREVFYLLACAPIDPTAPPRLAELADLARKVRDAVRGSFEVNASAAGAYLIGPRVQRTLIPGNLVEKVRAFLLAVDGKGVQDRRGKDYEGMAISDAEARFRLDEPATWVAERRALDERLDAAPILLHVDPEYVAHLAAQPGYVTYALKECARRTVLAPLHVFSGLKRGERCQKNLEDGVTYFGKPRRVDNAGRLTRAPDGMVFAVYADHDGFVFDWDWVEENPHEPGCPIDADLRFGNPCTVRRDADLVLPDSLPAPHFDRTQACYSPRGDCIFCYITDDPAYACRINTDLTVFRRLAERTKVTGFKVKNVRRILEEDKNIVINDDPDMTVSVQSALLATLKGHKDADVRVYDVLIEAFRTAPNPPPTVRVPKRTAERHALAHA